MVVGELGKSGMHARRRAEPEVSTDLDIVITHLCTVADQFAQAVLVPTVVTPLKNQLILSRVMFWIVMVIIDK